MATREEVLAKVKAAEETTNALKAQLAEIDKAEETADLGTVLALIQKHSFTAERLGFKTAAPRPAKPAAAKSGARPAKAPKLYFNPQAVQDERIYRGAGEAPVWYTKATDEQKEQMEVLDPKTGAELLEKYMKGSKKKKDEAIAKFVQYHSPTQLNPAV